MTNDHEGDPKSGALWANPKSKIQNRTPLAWLVWPYVALIGLWLLLRAVYFDQTWWLAVVNTIGEYLFLPLPLSR